MRYGISAAAILVEDRRVLLVRHRREGAFDFWVPPGGKLSGSESIFDCARREAFEETGLDVELDRVLYIQEFSQPDYHFCKFFILASSWRGAVTRENLSEDEDFLVDARFLTRNEIAEANVVPEILTGQFWEDLRTGFPETRYLGMERLDD